MIQDHIEKAPGGMYERLMVSAMQVGLLQFIQFNVYCHIHIGLNDHQYGS